MVIMVLIALAAAGCGGGASSASDILNAAAHKMDAAKSSHTDIDFNVSLTGDKQQVMRNNPSLGQLLPMNIGISAQADIDARDTTNVKLKIHDLKFTGLDKLAQKIGSANGSSAAESAVMGGIINQFASGMEFSFLKDTFYLKFAGTWYRMTSSDVPGAGDFSCAVQQLFSGSNMTNEFSNLKNVQQLPDEAVDGVSTRHIKAELDADRAMTQTNSGGSALQRCGFSGTGTNTTGDSGSVTGTSTGASAAINSALKSELDSLQLEFWIDGDNTLRQMKLSGDMDLGQLSGIAGDKSASSLKMAISATAKYSALGQNVDFSAPRNALSFKELLNGLGSSLGSGAAGVGGGAST